jgi:hypothetical protein
MDRSVFSALRMNAKDYKLTASKHDSATDWVADGTAVSTISPPLIPEVGVLALVPDHWECQPRHHIMTRLARYFSVVWRNVRFLGGKSAHELAAYPQHSDVCVMPYVQNSYTKCIYPLKLHDYLASGRPVVGPPIASLQQFREVILLPDTSDRWSAAITESLAPASNTVERREVRQNRARQRDWDILLRQSAETMTQRLGTPYSTLFAQSLQKDFAGSSRTDTVG